MVWLIRGFNNNSILFHSEDDFYSKVFFLLKKTENIIEAVDFIPPEQWLNNTVVKRYLEVQKSLKLVTKRRIHIFDVNQFTDTHIELYLQYVELMENANFELFFFDILDFNIMDFDIFGSMNIDNTCVIINENPEKGVQLGLVSFSENSINEYQNRFENLLTKSINSNDFIKHIKSLKLDLPHIT